MGIILASGSPRRKELLSLIIPHFSVIPSDADENIKEKLTPTELVEKLSLIKAKAVSEKFPQEITIGADTVVFTGGEILGKPKDFNDAKRMLKLLSGREHSVSTGVSILSEGIKDTFSVTTKVWFYPMSEEEIDSYIISGEPMDKAGAYGIQGKGALFIEKIEGDYYSVMGFPVSAVKRHLEILGFTCLHGKNDI